MAGAGDINILGNKYQEYKHEANEVVHFKLVRSESDVLDSAKEFHPDMSHQLFGESESIFGYKNLRVEVYCTGSYMKTYVNIQYTDKITPQSCDGLEADDIWKIINANLQPGYYTNRDEFIASLAKEKNFTPFGELVHSYNANKDGQECEFQIYKHGIEAVGFRAFHERIQPFLLFYVDAASYIDVDDERWTFYVLYEKYLSADKEAMYAFTGYMTVYNYYAYPEKIRPRISQVLVMPPYQKMGHGATLVQTFYNDCFTKAEILDVTVEDPSENFPDFLDDRNFEDPSENFQRVRDFVDARNCMKLNCFRDGKAKDKFGEAMVLEARDKLKLSKKQTRRVYEILRLRETDCSNPAEFREYRLNIKNRLNQPFQKNGRDMAKLKRALNSDEIAETLNNLSEEQRLEYLEREFNEIVDYYRQVLNRLATA